MFRIMRSYQVTGLQSDFSKSLKQAGGGHLICFTANTNYLT
jgi:hypothetical protein